MVQRRSALGGDPDEGAWKPLEGAAEPGMRVRVASLGKSGEVVGVRGTRVEVRLGAMTISADASDLQRPEGPPAATTRRVASGTATGHAPPRVSTVGRELKLIGKRVDEALPELERFLDAALLAGHEEVRIVHGHGTGRLRSAVRDFLTRHEQVAEYRSGGATEGGDGATVATLR
jgi:DNA mismatch repair protein MutS2